MIEEIQNEINKIKNNILNGNLCKWDIEICFNKLNKKIQKLKQYEYR